MNKKSYDGFTLIEMLIVMGILIILMVVGVTGGRFAINRANDVAHQNAVKQINEALQAYYTDNRSYPPKGTAGMKPQTLIGNASTTSAPLYKYMDSGAFKGGTEATYIYITEEGNNPQAVLVCVTLGGKGDATKRGIYCDGTGFGDQDITIPVSGTNMPRKEYKHDDPDASTVYQNLLNYSIGSSIWYGDSKGWTQN